MELFHARMGLLLLGGHSMAVTKKFFRTYQNKFSGHITKFPLTSCNFHENTKVLPKFCIAFCPTVKIWGGGMCPRAPPQPIRLRIVLNDLSDHLPNFACFHKDFNPYCHQKAFRRSFSEQYFREGLSEINWSNKLNGLDVNDSYDIFINEYTKIFEACFPMERIKCKSLQNHNSPWTTKRLLKSISKKIGFISN